MWQTFLFAFLVISAIITVTLVLVLQKNGNFTDKLTYKYLDDDSLSALQAKDADRSQVGLERMKGHKVIIMGLCRDVEKILPKTLGSLNELAIKFADYRIIIHENNSKDKTKDLLRDWNELSDKHILFSEDLPKGTLPKDRLSKMQVLRENQLKHYRELSRTFSNEFAIIVDLDLICIPTPQSVSFMFSVDDSWNIQWSFGMPYGMMSRKNVPAYVAYDSLAMVLNYADFNNNHKKSLMHESRKMDTDNMLTPMFSAFGGLGVYRQECLNHYAATYLSEKPICEHRVFHKNLYDAGFRNMFVNNLCFASR